MATAIVVDSAAALPAGTIDRLPVHVVPLHLGIDGEDHRDGDLSIDDLIARLDREVSTSAPMPGDYVTAIEAALGAADSVLVVTVSADMSASFKAARLAVQQYEDRDVRVFDSGTAAGAEALIVLAAARAAAGGASTDDVEAVARKVADRVRLVATVDNLDRLVQSGRVPNLAGWAANHLGVNPLFEFRCSQVRKLRPAMSRGAALERIAAACRDDRPNGAQALLHVAVLHAQAPDAAEILEASLPGADDGVDVDAFVTPFGPVMVTHTGPGLAGLAWWWGG
jgi:DegV family protein with EDD domain